jgi:hypothetical protein
MRNQNARIAFIVCAVLVGCATAPSGWKEAQAPDIEKVIAATDTVLRSADGMTLLSIGEIAAIYYDSERVANYPKETKMLLTINMLKEAYPQLNIMLIRNYLKAGVSVSDAELWIGFITYVVRARRVQS